MVNDIGKSNALQSLKPNAEWTLKGDILVWHDLVQTEPTESEIDPEVIRLQAEYDAQAYARNRKAEYDQLTNSRCSSMMTEIARQLGLIR
jgi:hypothetical protein